jgi:methyl-galactoside transport system substrate-binding protein
MLSTIMVLTIMGMILLQYKQNSPSASSLTNSRTPIKAAVVIHSFDPYGLLLRQNLEDVEKENNQKIEFTFWDAKDNQNIQNQIIDRLLQENIDLLLLNMVNVREDTVESIINKVKQKNIPIVFFFRLDIAKMRAFNDYPKAFMVTSDSKQAGTLQGKILINLWKSNKASIDKNNDNILQYIILKGPRTVEEANERTVTALSALSNAGIKTQELSSQVCNWSRDLARTSVNSLFINYGDRIEAIIANNDAMAIGAIDALQKYGYNKGDKSKTITVVGIDAIPEAKDLIKKGFMSGTVVNDAHAQAEALYTIGMNLVNNKNPLEGTNYKLYNNQKAVVLPFKEYTPQ